MTQKAKPRLSMVELWNSKDPTEWDYCEGELYDAAVKPENRMIERQLERPGLRERIALMDTAQFYDFLRDGYFKWKFTVEPGRSENAKALAGHVRDGTMDRVERVRRRLVKRVDDNVSASIQMMMGKHGGIRGLGVAGASGLLALVYPEEFGTVDVKVTEALQQVGLPQVMRINPTAIKIEDAVTMIEIMRVKALELNRMFGTNKWTPRLIDRVLWVAGRKRVNAAL
jgi:hypothetical protein